MSYLWSQQNVFTDATNLPRGATGCLTSNGDSHIFYGDQSTSQIKHVVYDGVTYSTTVIGSFSGGGADPQIRALSDSTTVNSRVFVCWYDGTNIKYRYYNNSWASAVTAVSAGVNESLTVQGITFHNGHSDKVAIFYNVFNSSSNLHQLLAVTSTNYGAAAWSGLTIQSTAKSVAGVGDVGSSSGEIAFFYWYDGDYYYRILLSSGLLGSETQIESSASTGFIKADKNYDGSVLLSKAGAVDTTVYMYRYFSSFSPYPTGTSVGVLGRMLNVQVDDSNSNYFYFVYRNSLGLYFSHGLFDSSGNITGSLSEESVESTASFTADISGLGVNDNNDGALMYTFPLSEVTLALRDELSSESSVSSFSSDSSSSLSSSSSSQGVSSNSSSQSSSSSSSNSSLSSSSTSLSSESSTSTSSVSSGFIVYGVTYYNEFRDIESITNPLVDNDVDMKFTGFFEEDWIQTDVDLDEFGYGIKKTKPNKGYIYCDNADRLFTLNEGYLKMNISFPFDIIDGLYQPLKDNASELNEYILWGVNIGRYEPAQPSLYAALTEDGIILKIQTSAGTQTLTYGSFSLLAENEVILEFLWSEHSFNDPNLRLGLIVDDEWVTGNVPIVNDSLEDVRFSLLNTPFLYSDLTCTIRSIEIANKIPTRILSEINSSSSTSSLSSG